MNFALKIKTEIAENGITDKCCAVALLSAYIKLNGGIAKRGKRLGLEFATDNEQTASFISELLNTYYNTSITELEMCEDKLNGRDRLIGRVDGEKAVKILYSLCCIKQVERGALEFDYSVNPKIIEKDCCKKAYLKGAFLGGGNITLPKETQSTTGYHLEAVFVSHQTAIDISSILAYFGFNPKIVRRKDNFVVYMKSSEEIKDFLALLGLNKCVLELSDMICRKEFSSLINRRRNCDLGNVAKQVNAASKQNEAFDLIEQTVGLDSLPFQLKEVVKARRENNEDTLTELAEKLGITKSCLNHRLRKILKIASELK